MITEEIDSFDGACERPVVQFLSTKLLIQLRQNLAVEVDGIVEFWNLRYHPFVGEERYLLVGRVEGSSFLPVSAWVSGMSKKTRVPLQAGASWGAPETQEPLLAPDRLSCLTSVSLFSHWPVHAVGPMAARYPRDPIGAGL